MITMLKNLLKSGQASTFDDSGDIQISKSNWLGRTKQTVESLVPYGTFGTPMAKVRQILFSLRGNESNIAALNSDSTNRIKKNTEPGEYGIGSPLTGANIYFKKNGDIVIEIPKENLIVTAGTKIAFDAPEVNLNSGSKGVARLDDSTLSTAVEDPVFWTWLAAAGALLAGLGVVAPIPTAQTGKINSASGTVKAGN